VNIVKSIVVSTPGGPESMELTEVPAPRPGPGEVLVDVVAAGVNFIDIYHRRGTYPLPTPFTPGQEGAGTVSAVGEDVDEFAIGDTVAWMHTLGSYAAQVCVPAQGLLPVPAGVDAHIAAALLLQGVTAHYLCCSTYVVQPGDDVLVHAAAGGVGLLLTQLVKRRGGRVFATVSTADKQELARAAGADEVFDYQDFAERIAECTNGAGVHVVYDGVGKSTFDAGLTALRPRGLMVLYGQASGPVPPIDPQILNQRGSLYLTRPTAAHYIADRCELRQRADELFAMVAAGELDVRIGHRYPLAQAAQAHEDLNARRTTGKLLLLP
jgi:NADPH2:quinone reductase